MSTAPAPLFGKAMPTVPMVRGLPFFGNFFDFRRRRLELQCRLLRECGDIGIFKMGPIPIVAVTSAELMQSILVEHAADFKKSRGLGLFAKPIIGEGLLSSEGDLHKKQRRLMAPAFAHKRIAGYATVMAERAERMAARCEDGAVVPVLHEMMRLTLGIVGKTLFDTDVEEDAPDVHAALTVTMEYMLNAATSPLPLPLHWPTPQNRRTNEAVRTLDDIVYRIIRERRASGGDRGDVLSMLLVAQDEDDGTTMTDKQVRDEVMTLFLAGHETTANALSWAFYLLGRHPAIYERLRAEADEVLAGRTPTVEDLPRLGYALQVFKEAMRLYPPAYMIGRSALRPVVLGGHQLPAGTVVFMHVWAMHRRADYFPAPESFNPDRFSPTEEPRIPKNAYMPFGGGPRICIGNHFALMEGQLLLAAIAQRVVFTPTTDAPVAPDALVTLRPSGSLPMRAHVR